ncbi:MAG: hypothetical protein SNG14_06400 [Rikenellaceae bacterium]
MKKFLFSIAAVAFMASASAETLLDINFEDGTRGTLNPWAKNESGVAIVGADKAKDGEHAFQIKTGVSTFVKGMKKGVKYKVSLDKKFAYGKSEGAITLEVYNAESKGFEKAQTVEMSMEKTYENVSFEFVSEKPYAPHRLTITPTKENKGGGSFFIDNLKVESVQ